MIALPSCGGQSVSLPADAQAMAVSWPDENGITIGLSYVLFDQSKVEIRVLEQSDQKSAKRLPELMNEIGAFAGCNGGYFHASGDFSPCGLQICSGNRTGKPDEGQYVASLTVQDEVPALIESDEFKDSPRLQQMVQCSPWLVMDGVSFPKSEGDVKNRRTFIATNGKGLWCIGCCTSIELSRLGNMLKDGQVVKGFKATRALNLDGGPSSGLWWKARDGTQGGLQQPAKVRNFIALFPKAVR